MATAEPQAVGKRLAELLEGWRAGEGPLAGRLAGRIAELAAGGRLAPGARLPSQRALAEAVSVGRGTVAAAYAALRERGLVDPDGRLAATPDPRRQVAGQDGPLAAPPDGPRPVVDLSGGQGPPDGGPHMGAVVLGLGGADWAELIAEDGALGGMRALRGAVAARYSALGLPTRPEQVVVTGGTRAGLELVCAHYLEPGAAVAIEEPTSPVALEAFQAAGARLLPVAVDRNGVRPSAVQFRFEQDAPRLLYLTPARPGAAMPAGRRRGIAALTGVFGIPLVEDGTQADLGLGPAGPAPPLAAFDRTAPVLSLGSMRELFWPELRVGWIRAPDGTAEELARLQTGLGGTARPAAQFLAARLLDKGDQEVAERRARLAGRLERLAAVLAARLPSWTWAPGEDGASVWVHLPAGSATALAERAAREGVVVRPGPGGGSGPEPDDRLLLPLTAEPELLEEGVHRLARAWAASSAGTGTRPGPGRRAGSGRTALPERPPRG